MFLDKGRTVFSKLHYDIFIIMCSSQNYKGKIVRYNFLCCSSPFYGCESSLFYMCILVQNLLLQKHQNMPIYFLLKHRVVSCNQITSPCFSIGLMGNIFPEDHFLFLLLFIFYLTSLFIAWVGFFPPLKMLINLHRAQHPFQSKKWGEEKERRKQILAQHCDPFFLHDRFFALLSSHTLYGPTFLCRGTQALSCQACGVQSNGSEL